ncbi:hypothetical protein JI75_04835 [Berryella intestinalis]|uniref:Glutamine amidotransferase domain-containing protein n=1 Tax=Berryella intestinalis TaxID=1531429 RepID=A0A0A8B3Q2_9ACTN|nr:aminodeoxychorismate/anthranilate synthase component II [Berryella intestinalis]AJC12096.1 hypothetical protein JI75_04835 [Berryella intestinalis]
MLLIIDNFDSFVHMLESRLRALGADTVMVRSDRIRLADVDALRLQGKLEGIVLSPGPKSPDEAGICIDAVRRFGREVPILGVCLGHQAIVRAYGGRVVQLARPMHGRVSVVETNGRGLFEGLQLRFEATRYHSLAADERTLPECLRVDARSDDGQVMAIAHRRHPVFGLQFHPEALLTQYGDEVLGAFLARCGEADRREAGR